MFFNPTFPFPQARPDLQHLFPQGQKSPDLQNSTLQANLLSGIQGQILQAALQRRKQEEEQKRSLLPNPLHPQGLNPAFRPNVPLTGLNQLMNFPSVRKFDLKILTDTGEDLKLVHRQKRPKVDTLFSPLFFRRFRATSMTQRQVENARVHF